MESRLHTFRPPLKMTKLSCRGRYAIGDSAYLAGWAVTSLKFQPVRNDEARIT